MKTLNQSRPVGFLDDVDRNYHYLTKADRTVDNNEMNIK